MIFYGTKGILFYGRIFTLISFYFFYNPTIPILAVYVDPRWTNLDKDATRSRGMVIRKVSTVPRRTLVSTAGWTMLSGTLTGLGKVRPPIVVRRVVPT